MKTKVQEKVLAGHKIGGLMVFLVIALYAGAVFGVFHSSASGKPWLMIVCGIVIGFGWIPLLGLKVLKPNEALVLTLFGRYVGTLKGDGFFWVNPFCTAFNPAAGTRLGQSGDVAAPKNKFTITRNGRADGYREQKDLSQGDDAFQQPAEGQRCAGQSRRGGGGGHVARQGYRESGL